MIPTVLFIIHLGCSGLQICSFDALKLRLHFVYINNTAISIPKFQSSGAPSLNQGDGFLDYVQTHY